MRILLLPRNTMPCTALKTTDSLICNKVIPEGRTLCGIHESQRIRSGPNAFRVKQLKLKHKLEKKEHDERMAPIMQEVRALPIGSAARALLLDRYINESGELRTRHRVELAALKTQILNEIARNGGVNPDQVSINRKATRRIIREWGLFRRQMMRWPQHNFEIRIGEYRQRIEDIINTNQFGAENNQELRNHLDFVAEDYLHLLQDAVVRVQPIQARAEANPNENIGAFARDKQNVHTSAAVNQVKHNISIIRQIFVPPEYRWNLTTISNTYREIVYDCNLSPKGNWQFSAMYCSDATIYDMEKGIFGIMVDGVWQYIRDSEDKRCLINILKREFEDNIGMCAQGNLSRVCNILSGYLPGIGHSESAATILGREFPKLMEIENETDRVFRGTEILRNNNVPNDEWEAWLEPLRA